MTIKVPHHRSANIAILAFLLVSCLFFAGYDVLYEKVWWSTWAIYVPCSAVFSFGLYSWTKLLPRNLFILGILFVAIDLFLVAYGLYLLISGESLWGTVTLGFSLLTIGMTLSTFLVKRESAKLG
jgi:hypothetical protein